MTTLADRDPVAPQTDPLDISPPDPVRIAPLHDHQSSVHCIGPMLGQTRAQDLHGCVSARHQSCVDPWYARYQNVTSRNCVNALSCVKFICIARQQVSSTDTRRGGEIARDRDTSAQDQAAAQDPQLSGSPPTPRSLSAMGVDAGNPLSRVLRADSNRPSIHRGTLQFTRCRPSGPLRDQRRRAAWSSTDKPWIADRAKYGDHVADLRQQRRSPPCRR